MSNIYAIITVIKDKKIKIKIPFNHLLGGITVSYLSSPNISLVALQLGQTVALRSTNF